MSSLRYALVLLLLLGHPAQAIELLKQSTAVTVKMGPLVDAVDGFTPETGLSLTQADFRLSKNAGNMAQKSDSTSATHDEIGVYDVPLNATDTDSLGRLRIDVYESGARPVIAEFLVLPANLYDTQVLGAEHTENGDRVWYVDGTNDGAGDTGTQSAPFDTITAAISASAEGDTIYVAPGTYAGQVTPKNGQTIVGAGMNLTTITHNSGTLAGAIKLVNVNNVTIKGLKAEHIGTQIGIQAGNCLGLTLEDVWAYGPQDGMRADDCEYTTIRRCRFGSKYDALILDGKNCLVEDSELVTTGAAGSASAPPGAFRTSAGDPSKNDATITLRNCVLRVERTTSETFKAYCVEVDAQSSVILDRCHLYASTTADDGFAVVGVGTEEAAVCEVIGGTTIRTVNTEDAELAYDLEQLNTSTLQVDPATVSYDDEKTAGTITTPIKTAIDTCCP